MTNDLEARSKSADQLIEALLLLVGSHIDANNLPSASSGTTTLEPLLGAHTDEEAET